MCDNKGSLMQDAQSASIACNFCLFSTTPYPHYHPTLYLYHVSIPSYQRSSELKREQLPIISYAGQPAFSSVCNTIVSNAVGLQTQVSAFLPFLHILREGALAQALRCAL